MNDKKRTKKLSKKESIKKSDEKIQEEFETYLKRERSRTRESLSQYCLDNLGKPIPQAHDHSIAIDMLRDRLSCSEVIYLQAHFCSETKSYIILCNDKSIYKAKDNIQIWSCTTPESNRPEVVESVVSILSCFLTILDYEVVIEKSAYVTGLFNPYNIRDSEENMRDHLRELEEISSLG